MLVSLSAIVAAALVAAMLASALSAERVGHVVHVSSAKAARDEGAGASAGRTGDQARLLGTASGTRTSGGRADLTLAAQSSWVRLGGRFDLHLGIAAALDRAHLRLSVVVDDRLSTRSALVESFRGVPESPAIDTIGPLSLSSLPTDAVGDRVLSIAVDHGGAVASTSASSVPKPTATLQLYDCASCTGVYPVQVELTDTSGSHLARFTTEMVVVPPTTPAAPLQVSWVLPIGGASVPVEPDGTFAATRGEVAQAGSVADALSSVPEVPVTLAPSPATLEALADNPSGRARQAIATLAALVAHTPTHELLARPWAPVSSAELAASGLGDLLVNELQAGARTDASVLGARPAKGLWVALGPVTAAGLDDISSTEHLGTLVLPSSALRPIGSNLPPTHPFALDGLPHTSVFRADPALATELAGGTDPVLAAHDVLADLAMIYFGRPNATHPRGVVMTSPPASSDDLTFLETLLGGLASGHIVHPVTLGELSSSVGEATTSSGSTLVRSLAKPPSALPSLPATTIRHVLGVTTDLASVFGTHAPVVAGLRRSVLALAARRSALPSESRSAFVAGLEHAIGSAKRAVKVSANHTLTLTATNGTIPVSVLSSAGAPVHVLVSLRSAELDFTGGGTHLVTVSGRDETVTFTVRARTSGEFPVHVELLSPEGHLVLDAMTLSLRSTAGSVVAIALSVLALAVLLAWWVRSARRSRRAKQAEAAGGADDGADRLSLSSATLGSVADRRGRHEHR